MPTQSRTRRTQQERVEESSQRILEAAVELIAAQGFERTKTRDISERAGFSNAMVHERYGSKTALLEALLRSYEDHLFDSRTPQDGSGLRRLLGQIESVRHQLRGNPQLMRAIFMVQFEIPIAIKQLRAWQNEWTTRYIDHLAATIREGQADGSIRTGIDPTREAIFFTNVGTGVMFRWILNPETVDLDSELADWAERMKRWFAH